MSVFAGYVRVSRVGDREETLLSPKLQERQIRAWASGRGVELVMLPAELDASGGDDSRPVLLGAIDQVERGELAGIVVAKFDRLSRSMKGQLAMLERIESAGGEVRSVAEDLDPTTPQGRMTRNILFSVATGEREQRAQEFERAKADAVARGVWTAGHVPLGYRKGEERRLVPDPDTAAAVIHAFERRAGGASWRAVADELGVRLRRPFYGPSASRIVGSDVYLGVSRQGRYVNASAHEALVSRDLWERAQLDHPRPPRGTHGPALLGGLVRCAGCSWRMTSTIRRGRREYRCRRRGARGVCAAPAIIAASIVEPYVTELVLSHVEGMTVETTRRTDVFATAEGALAEATAERDAFLEATAAAGVEAEHFAKGLRLRAKRVEEARRGLAEARLAAEPLPAPGTVREVWEGLDVGERNHVLRRALSVVWVRKGRGDERIRVVDRSGGHGLPVQGRPAEPVTLDWAADLEGEVLPADVVDAPLEALD